jgi:hypothetical protein
MLPHAFPAFYALLASPASTLQADALLPRAAGCGGAKQAAASSSSMAKGAELEVSQPLKHFRRPSLHPHLPLG